MTAKESTISRLMTLIEDRKVNRPPDSYTTQLFNGGARAIGAKIREEAAELAEAADRPAPSRDDIVHEAADLTYHLLVMLAQCDANFAQVEAELVRRFGTSGLEEKASREKR